MQQVLDAQQQQINQLMQQVRTRDKTIDQLQQQVSQVQSAASQAKQKADAASSQANQAQQSEVTALKGDVTDLKENLTNTAASLQDTQKTMGELQSPIALRFKGITITPGGFLAAETVWRQRGLASDVNTPFNSLPFPGSSASNLSEFFASGRQSRVSMLAEGKLKDLKMAGYVEADFLSAGVTSNNNQSNSYTLRQRQMWAQAALHGWTFTGGQMWSLVTETKKGVDNRSEALPMTIDAQYSLGFSWARQFGFRVAKSFGDKGQKDLHRRSCPNRCSATYKMGEPSPANPILRDSSLSDYNDHDDHIACTGDSLMGTQSWTVAEAKAKFSEIIERAMSEGPQTITRKGRTAAVVVGAEEWERKTKRVGSLAEFFAASPLRGSGLKVRRRKERPRKINL